MSSLFVAVFDDAAEVALGKPTQEFIVDISGTSAASAVISGIDNRHKRVRLWADIDCFVTWDVGTPTAINDGSGGRPLGAKNPEYFAVQVGQKLAVIAKP